MHESEKWKVKSLSRIQLLATPWTAAYQAPPPMGFSRQEYWSGVPLPSPFHWLASLVIRPIMGPWYHALRRAYTSGVFFPNMHNNSIYSWKKKKSDKYKLWNILQKHLTRTLQKCQSNERYERFRKYHRRDKGNMTTKPNVKFWFGSWIRIKDISVKTE